MSDQMLFNRFALAQELSGDEVFRYLEVRDARQENARVLLMLLNTPWSGNTQVMSDLHEYFDRLQSVRHPVVNRVVTVNQNTTDGFGVAFEWPGDQRLSEIGTVSSLFKPLEIADQLCDALHRSHVKGVYHGHLRAEDIWVSGKTIVLAGFGYLPVILQGWRGSQINVAPELTKGNAFNATVDVYSAARLLTELYPEQVEVEPLQRALSSEPNQRPGKIRDLQDALNKLWNPQPEKKPPPPNDSKVPEVAPTQKETVEQVTPEKHKKKITEELTNLIRNSWYLSQQEEERAKDRALNTRGVDVSEFQKILQAVLDNHGAVSERELLDQLGTFLHQLTDAKKRLEEKEEKEVLDKVVKPEPGKKKGLIPEVGESYINNFCQVNGVRRGDAMKGGEELRKLVRARVFDNYCDRQTERELIRDGVEKWGMDRQDAQISVEMELEVISAASERKLVNELDGLLDQFVKDGKLTERRWKDAREYICNRGLKHQIAEQHIMEYCRSRRVKVKKGWIGWEVP